MSTIIRPRREPIAYKIKPLTHAEAEYFYNEENLEVLESYKDNIIRCFNRCFEPLIPRDRLFLADWMDTLYKKPMEEGTGEPWRTRAMQAGIMVALCHTDVKKIFFQKVAQFGGTTIAVAAQNYFNVEYDYNTCYYLPNDPEAKEHSKSKWSTMIRDIPKLSKALVAPSVETQHPKNLDTFKMFSTSSAYCRGAISKSRFQRITLHFVVLDEIDRMGRTIGKKEDGEGSPVGLVEGRFGEQGYGKLFVLGTPTRLGDSPIHELCDACEFMYEWHAPCPLCNKKQIMIWGNEHLDHGVKWDKTLTKLRDQANTVHYVCKHCKKGFDHNQFRRVKEKGVWVCASDGSWIDHKNNCFRDKDGKVMIKGPDEVSFVASPDCSGLLSNKSWADGLFDFLRAVNKANKGKSDDLVTWFNTYAGVPFREKSQKEADPNRLFKRREEYYGKIDPQILKLTMGIDFQGKFCKYQIDGHGLGGEQWALFSDRFDGRVDDINSEYWDKLDVIANKTYHDTNGRPLRIEVVIADAGYHPRNVLKWCGRNKDQRIAVKGDGKRADRPLFEVDWKKDFVKDYNCWYVTIGPHQASRLLYMKLAVDQVGDNYYHFPKSDYFNIDYFDELTADKETFRRVGNDFVVRYDKENKNVANEAHDTAKYNIVALEVLEITGRAPWQSARRLGQDDAAPINTKTPEQIWLETLINPEDIDHDEFGWIKEIYQDQVTMSNGFNSIYQ
jgi:phage terminase large subunit GpA-like protein